MGKLRDKYIERLVFSQSDILHSYYNTKYYVYKTKLQQITNLNKKLN